MNTKLSIALLLIIFLAKINSQDIKEPNDADNLNNAGFELYSKGKYSEASMLFEKAVKLNSNHMYAEYNLACTLALLNNDQSNLDRIIDLLISVLKKNPSKIHKIKMDKDLDSIRNTAIFKYILNNHKILSILTNSPLLVNKKLYLDRKSNFNESKSGYTIYFYTDDKVSLIPVERIFFNENQNVETIIYEEYTSKKESYVELANMYQLSPISSSFIEEYTTSINIIIAIDNLIQSKKIDTDELSYTPFSPVLDLNSFGNKSFYFNANSFAGSFSIYTTFFTIQNNNVLFSDPITTYSENQSGLDFGFEYQFNTLTEETDQVSIVKSVYNFEDEEINNIKANSSEEYIENIKLR